MFPMQNWATKDYSALLAGIPAVSPAAAEGLLPAWLFSPEDFFGDATAWGDRICERLGWSRSVVGRSGRSSR